MTLETYRREVRIARSATDVFAWHERPGARERLTPPWMDTRVISGPTDGVRDGSRLVLRVRRPWPSTWEVEHRDYEAGVQFRDVARRGPLAHWEHLHRVEPEGLKACRWSDEVRYAVPGGPLGRILRPRVRRELERLFAWRHAVLRGDLERLPPLARQRVLITGGSGLIGRALGAVLSTQGHEVVCAVRRESRGPHEVAWDGASGLEGADPFDVVVHLAGENIAAGRWTSARRDTIHRSRVAGTRGLVTAMARWPARPRLFVCASAVGFYGDAGDRWCDEESPRGSGFLADVCEAWEAEAAATETHGWRVVRLRFGAVISAAGGALAKMLPLFRLGLGGVLGPGTQWMSWISPDDLAAIVLHAIATPALRGPVNAVAPVPVRNREWTQALAAALHRPAVLPVPAAAVRAVFGAMGEETVLASQRVRPAALERSGFFWRHPTVTEALAQTLGHGARAE